jgi:16S rRNA (guanine527-N7)-methyltransferase
MARASLPPEARLQSLAGELDLQLAPDQCAALLAYGELLRRWNRVHNLTSIDAPEDLLSHHLLDCLAIVRPIDAALIRCGLVAPGTSAAQARIDFLDAGSGAGLPGIPLALARPRWNGCLVDAVGKKCAFLQQAIVELDIRNLEVRHARLESASLPRCTLVVSRAFASLRDFVALTRERIAPGGLWVAMRGREGAAAAHGLPADVQLVQTITLRVPLLAEQRHLVILRAPESAQQRARDREPALADARPRTPRAQRPQR